MIACIVGWRSAPWGKACGSGECVVLKAPLPCGGSGTLMGIPLCSVFFSRRLQEDPPAGVSGAPSENNIMMWNAVIFG